MKFLYFSYIVILSVILGYFFQTLQILYYTILYHTDTIIYYTILQILYYTILHYSFTDITDAILYYITL